MFFFFKVPAGTTKKLLLAHLDNVPTYVQQLQFTVKEPTVGRSATFCKVDNVIQETKRLMNVISKVVTTCFECANKVLFKSILYLALFTTYTLIFDEQHAALYKSLVNF